MIDFDTETAISLERIISLEPSVFTVDVPGFVSRKQVKLPVDRFCK